MDIVDRETRSRLMAGITGKNTRPEVTVRSYLHRAGLRFRLHDKRLPGKPDIVLPRWRTVVLVHGCFWHRHPGCAKAYNPKSNLRFWQEKFAGTMERDERKTAELRRLGWRVIVIWECQLDSKSLDRLVRRVRQSR